MRWERSNLSVQTDAVEIIEQLIAKTETDGNLDRFTPQKREGRPKLFRRTLVMRIVSTCGFPSGD